MFSQGQRYKDCVHPCFLTYSLPLFKLDNSCELLQLVENMSRQGQSGCLLFDSSVKIKASPCGENRPVIRDTRDSRCYVNIPTTLPSSTLPMCCAALTPHMNHRATSGLACWKGLCRFGTLYVCGVCRFGPDNPRLRLPLSSPWLPHLSDYSGCTMHFGSPPLAGPVKALWI